MSALPGGDTAMLDRPDQDEDRANPILLVHRALRGRYRLALLLGLILAIPCAIAGYLAVPPVYTSTAVLEASPTLPALLYENDLNESMPAFDAFVAQQGERLRSERVLSKALDNKELRATGWPGGSPGLIRLREALEVVTPKRTNQIYISVTDQNPNQARIAAASIIESYEAIRREFESTSFGQRQLELERLRDRYLRDRNESRRTALDRALSVAGTEDLEAAQKRKLEELARIEEEIRDLSARRRQLSGEVTEEPIAEFEDPDLLMLKQDLQNLQRTLNALLQTFTPQHRQCRRIRSEINVVESLIAAREGELEELKASLPDTTDTETPLDLTGIDDRLTDLGRLRDEAKNTLERIARVQLDVLALQQEAEEANSRFEDAERRLEGLRVEKQSQNIGRIRIAREPEHPLRASSDRRKQLAAVGFVGGGGSGVAIVAAFGIVFARVRVADDVSSTTRDFAMLGMIPEFPDPTENDAQADLLDSFHLLRVIIDARSRPGCLVAGVTSPVSGDGKTTVSLLLARSFAMTRRRVLLIDADLVGRGLTRTLNAEPRDTVPEASLADLVVPVENGRMDLLPASLAETASDSFCRHVLQRLLRAAREEYDVVLLDTGPILGSIEAAAMVPVVDQMLLIVSRGLESRMLKMSTNRLRELQASSVGLVFNRASTVDFHRSYSPISSTSRRQSSRTLGSALPPMRRDEPAKNGREGAHG